MQANQPHLAYYLLKHPFTSLPPSSSYIQQELRRWRWDVIPQGASSVSEPSTDANSDFEANRAIHDSIISTI